MRTSEENIRQLLEMLDNPNAYSEQQIQDIIYHDEDTLETYRLMVEAKRSSRHRQARESVDVDAAWQRFDQRLQAKHKPFGQMRAPITSRLVASMTGVLLASGIALAAIHIVRQHQKVEAPKTEVAESVTNPAATAPADTLARDTTATQPVVYDNIPLEKMLPEIAAHYDAQVTFANDDARQLRFRFVWNPQSGIDQVVSDLNQFQRLSVTRKGNQITVDVLSDVSEK